jgi:pimeloyl-ACP methyl ester carboxylesterase
MVLKKICLALLFYPTLLLARQPNIPDGWTDQYAYVNGARIHYYHAVPAPGKPVIVMVHGITDNGLCWTTLTLKLQAMYDIYMLDTRGHGLSDPVTANDNGETLVKDVVDFVKTMNFEKPILIGHSMGAATVMRLGASYPDLAKAIVMLDPGLRAPAGTAAPARSGTAPATAAPRTAAARPQTSSPDRLSVSMFGSPETLVAQNNYKFEDLVATGRRQFPMWSDTDIQYWALSKKQYHGTYVTQASQAVSGTMNTRNALEQIVAPALILKADASPEVRKNNELAAAVMKNGRLVHIDGAGHNLHHDKLERTTEVLTEFLAGLK